FGSNLTLRNKKVEEIPSKQWATLCVARKNFAGNELSFSLAPRVGFEPTTLSLHSTQYFHTGVDYIIILHLIQNGWDARRFVLKRMRTTPCRDSL
ncbi:MAG: hypothetical protein Q7S63_03135, partial [bacterium]|nr:hypothetical protein [bacterium]